MRPSALALALLLAAAPAAHATEVTPDAKPEMRAVEVAAPKIRTDAVAVPARADARDAEAAAVQQLNVSTIVIIALVVIGVLALASLI